MTIYWAPLKAGFCSMVLIAIVLTFDYSIANDTKLAEAKHINKSDPSYIEPRVSKDTVFIFIHGLFGDAFETWYNKQSKKHFYDLLREDKEATFKDVDFFVYGFPSKFWGKSGWTAVDAVADLNQALKAADIYSYKRIVLVGHSMGGLVAQQFLLTFRAVAQKVPLLFMFSTPQEGSKITYIAQHISGNPAIQDMLPGGNNEFLKNLDHQWKAARADKAIPTQVRCAYEKEPTYGVTVVDEMSGTRFCDGVSAPVYADHIDIVKPVDASSSQAYKALKNAYRDVVSLRLSSLELSSVQDTPTQGHCKANGEGTPRVIVTVFRHRGDESPTGRAAFNNFIGLLEDRLVHIGQNFTQAGGQAADLSYLSSLSICYINGYPMDEAGRHELLSKGNFLELMSGTFFALQNKTHVRSMVLLNTDPESLRSIDMEFDVKPEIFGELNDLFSAATIYTLAVDARRLNHHPNVRAAYLKTAMQLVNDLPPSSKQKTILKAAISREMGALSKYR